MAWKWLALSSGETNSSLLYHINGVLDYRLAKINLFCEMIRCISHAYARLRSSVVSTVKSYIRRSCHPRSALYHLVAGVGSFEVREYLMMFIRGDKEITSRTQHVENT
jgi:hypothetical protein